MGASVSAASDGLLENVQERIGARALTREFRAPSAAASIINQRGELLRTVDLGASELSALAGQHASP
jgi:hypothetical protein